MISGLRFTGYKSFTEEYADIDELSNITVFIGRNNSGKSSCIDVIEKFINPDELATFQHEQKDLIIEIENTLYENDIDDINPYFIQISKYKADILKKQYIGKKMYLEIIGIKKSDGTNQYSYKRVPNDKEFDKKYSICWDNIEKQYRNTSFRYKFRRLNAERNIVAEAENAGENIDSNGTGATNLVRKFLNNSEYNEKLIEDNLMTAVNQIIYPDSEFSGIKVQQIENGENFLWEIFLQEGKKTLCTF